MASSASMEYLKAYVEGKRNQSSIEGAREKAFQKLKNRGLNSDELETAIDDDPDVIAARLKQQQGLQVQPEEEGTPKEETPEEKAKREEDATPPEKAANFTYKLAKSGGQAAGSRIAALPAPGDLGFPLLILLVFFFLIVPINGKTRAMWLWEVIVGNARVPTVPITPAGGGPDTINPVTKKANPAGVAGTAVANDVLTGFLLSSNPIGFGDTAV